jgi:hypothetical protein
MSEAPGRQTADVDAPQPGCEGSDELQCRLRTYGYTLTFGAGGFAMVRQGVSPLTTLNVANYD